MRTLLCATLCCSSALQVPYTPAVRSRASSPLMQGEDAIRDMVAASRERSYAGGRDGCCSKAGSYLEQTMKQPAQCDGAAAPGERPATEDEAKRAWLAGRRG